MPYYLAPLWEVHCANTADHRRGSSKKRGETRNKTKRPIPRELRLRLKRARAARGMLQGLEEDVRGFLQRWNDRQVQLGDRQDDNDSSDDSYSDDEVVFVGRKGFRDIQGRGQEDHVMILTDDEPEGEKMVFESRVDDRAASFG